MGPSHASFTGIITKNTQPLPYKLEMAKQKKYKVSDYSRLNQRSTRKFASSIRQLSLPKGTTKSFLAVSPVFPSSRLEPKRRKKNRTLNNARRACVTRLSHPHAPPARFPPSINTVTKEEIKWQLLNLQ